MQTISTENLLEGNDFLVDLFDAMPCIALVVDGEGRIRYYNEAATVVLGKDRSQVYMHKGGDALRCVHASETAEGCGHAVACQHCVVRGSAMKAIGGGKAVRIVTKMELATNGNVNGIYLMVSAAPFRFAEQAFAVIFLKDVTEVIQLKDLMPICCSCKKIRDDEHYWQSIEDYLVKHHHVYLSHGICAECAQKIYGIALHD